MLAARKGLKVQTLSPEDAEATAISECFEPTLVDGQQAKPMESSSPSVPFPLLASPASYDPLSFPLRKPHDDPKELTTLERQWIAVFKKSIPSFRFAPLPGLLPSIYSSILLPRAQPKRNFLGRPVLNAGPPECS